jgi:hypothetical protein
VLWPAHVLAALQRLLDRDRERVNSACTWPPSGRRPRRRCREAVDNGRLEARLQLGELGSSFVDIVNICEQCPNFGRHRLDSRDRRRTIDRLPCWQKAIDEPKPGPRLQADAFNFSLRKYEWWIEEVAFLDFRILGCA